MSCPSYFGDCTCGDTTPPDKPPGDRVGVVERMINSLPGIAVSTDIQEWIEHEYFVELIDPAQVTGGEIPAETLSHAGCPRVPIHADSRTFPNHSPEPARWHAYTECDCGSKVTVAGVSASKHFVIQYPESNGDRRAVTVDLDEKVVVLPEPPAATAAFKRNLKYAAGSCWRIFWPWFSFSTPADTTVKSAVSTEAGYKITAERTMPWYGEISVPNPVIMVGVGQVVARYRYYDWPEGEGEGGTGTGFNYEGIGEYCGVETTYSLVVPSVPREGFGTSYGYNWSPFSGGGNVRFHRVVDQWFPGSLVDGGLYSVDGGGDIYTEGPDASTITQFTLGTSFTASDEGRWGPSTVATYSCAWGEQVLIVPSWMHVNDAPGNDEYGSNAVVGSNLPDAIYFWDGSEWLNGEKGQAVALSGGYRVAFGPGGGTIPYTVEHTIAYGAANTYAAVVAALRHTLPGAYLSDNPMVKGWTGPGGHGFGGVAAQVWYKY